MDWAKRSDTLRLLSGDVNVGSLLLPDSGHAAFGRCHALKFQHDQDPQGPGSRRAVPNPVSPPLHAIVRGPAVRARGSGALRSEEHTSELQSQSNLVCRLLLEKKKKSTSLAPHA